MWSTSEITYLIITGTILLLLLGVFITSFLFLYQRRHNRHIKEKRKLQFQYQQELLRTQLEIQEQTLQNISQEIHDNIGQVLSLTKINLGTMDIQQPESLQQKIDDSKKLVSKAIQDLRDLSKSLNTDYVTEMGLPKSIAYQLELISKNGSMETDLEVSGIPVKLQAQKDLILFRIVQEALNNTIKHSNCKKINVHLNFEPNKFILLVHDDGDGFDLTPPLTEQHQHGFGLGIRNMHNRAKMIGADFNISSTPGKGTTVTVSLPF